jgi:hypothetical protein
MRMVTALIATMLFTAGPALAQAPAGGAQQKSSASQMQAAPTQPVPTDSKAQANAAAPAEKLDPAKDAAIRHLMEITGESKMGENISTGITNQVHTVMGRSMQADQLTKFMNAFSQKFNAGAPPSAVTDAVVPIYARHFSLEDIQGITKFYESPLGQRLVKTMPDISEESQSAGIQMDQKVAMDVLRSMSNEYPELKQLLPPDPASPAASAPAPGAPSTPPAAPAPQPQPKPQQ